MSSPARKVRFFADIDLVINAPRAGTVWPSAKTVSRAFDINATPFRREHITITFAPKLVKTLDKLLADTGTDLVWHSTWVETPASVVRFTSMIGGLYGGDFVRPPILTASGNYVWDWKARRIIRYMEEHGPSDFIVADDELPVWKDHLDEFAEQHDIRFLPVAPLHDWFESPGLTPEHVDSVRQFIAAAATQPA